MHILLGVPCAQGGVTEECLHSVLALDRHCRVLGWQLTVLTRADGLITRSRNIFASQAMRRDHVTHLLMADADLGFEPAVVERLVRSEHDVVGACVPLREVRWDRVRAAIDAAGDLSAAELAAIAHSHAVTFEPADVAGIRRTPVHGFLPARFVGGALLMIRRSALVRLAGSDQVAAYDTGGRWGDAGASGWTFFDPLIDPADRNYLSEDYAFCQRWRAVGGTVWVDLRSRVTHRGSIAIHGDPAVSVRVAERLTRGRETT